MYSGEPISSSHPMKIFQFPWKYHSITNSSPSNGLSTYYFYTVNRFCIFFSIFLFIFSFFSFLDVVAHGSHSIRLIFTSSLFLLLNLFICILFSRRKQPKPFGALEKETSLAETATRASHPLNPPLKGSYIDTHWEKEIQDQSMIRQSTFFFF